MVVIAIIEYESNNEPRWDDFIRRAKNGNFLFFRKYVEYHSGRFEDNSLLFLDDNRVIAVMPANIRDDVVTSHGGLTFGGIISDRKMRASLMLKVFEALVEYMRNRGHHKLIYKAIPHIYHDIPAEEDLYALFRYNAKLIRRDVSATIYTQDRDRYSKGRKWTIKKSKDKGFVVRQSNDFKNFMKIEEFNLVTRHGVRPVHTAAELALLASRFPQNIKLFASYRSDDMQGGVVVFESKNVVHTQYIAASEEGRQNGAADIILDFLINAQYAHKKYFDFGISTEHQGHFLNKGLSQYKESFGARATVYDFYELEISS